jgi:hypothetical protein
MSLNSLIFLIRYKSSLYRGFTSPTRPRLKFETIYAIMHMKFAIFERNGTAMERLLKFAALSVGGWLGWWAGSFGGIMVAFILSVIGSGLGVYGWIWISRRYLGR